MYKIFVVLGCVFSLQAMSPSAAIEKLMEGNKRFQKNMAMSPNQDTSRRQAVMQSQNPFAVIVACADSRVAPEILFDQGIGDLFVVRVAGNVIGPFEMESIEYAAKYLGSSCIIVMGHENCGAVDAVIKGTTADIRYIAQIIKASVIKARQQRARNLLQTAIQLNAEAMGNFVQQSDIISGLMSKGKIDVRAAYYNFQTGAVELL